MCICPTDQPFSWNANTNCKSAIKVINNKSSPTQTLSPQVISTSNNRENIRIKIQDRKCKKENSNSTYDPKLGKCVKSEIKNQISQEKSE
jgi:hypothetical protein